MFAPHDRIFFATFIQLTFGPTLIPGGRRLTATVRRNQAISDRAGAEPSLAFRSNNRIRVVTLPCPKNCSRWPLTCREIRLLSSRSHSDGSDAVTVRARNGGRQPGRAAPPPYKYVVSIDAVAGLHFVQHLLKIGDVR